MSMDVLGLGFVALFAVLIGLFTIQAARRPDAHRPLRRIPAFDALPQTVGQAVETGRRLHLSVGTGSLGDADTAATLAGLTMVDQLAGAAAISDRPPVVTGADGAAVLLAQDTLRGVYARQNALARYDPESAQVAGLTPLSFGAATTTLQRDEAVAGTVLIGAVGSEAVLLAESAARVGATTLAGATTPAAQAMLFATADQPLIGEDVFAAGAYLGASGGGTAPAAHRASLQAQDWVRLLIAGAILAGTLLSTAADLGRLVGLF
jgi:hypothetical protein